MSYKIVDINNVPEVLSIIKTLKSKKIFVGIFKGETLLIATINEFGAEIKVTEKMRAYLRYSGLFLKKETTHITVPERSFIRKGYQLNLKKITNYVNKQIELLFNMKITVEQLYQRVGSYCVSRIQEFLTDLKKPANHPFTIKRKHSSNPLIDTGNLRQSIVWRLE